MAFLIGNHHFWSAIFDQDRASLLLPQGRGGRLSLCERPGTKQRRIAFIQALRQRALPHSPLLISFFTRQTHSYEFVAYRTATLTRFFLRGNKELYPGDHIEWSRYVHRFTRDEVAAELKTAGFRVAHYSGEEDGSGQAVGIAE